MPALRSGSSASRTVGHHLRPTAPSVLPFVKSPVITTARGLSSTSAVTRFLVMTVASLLFGRCRSDSTTNDHSVDLTGLGTPASTVAAPRAGAGVGIGVAGGAGSGAGGAG